MTSASYQSDIKEGRSLYDSSRNLKLISTKGRLVLKVIHAFIYVLKSPTWDVKCANKKNFIGKITMYLMIYA